MDKKRNNLRYGLTALLLCGSMAVMGSTLRGDTLVVADTTGVADDADAYELPKPKDFNALRFTLDRHHRFEGDALPKGRTFVDFGAGLSYINHYNSGEVEPLTTIHLRMGRDFNRLHSARIGIGGGISYMRSGEYGEGPNTLFGVVSGEADYLFNLSSYLLGYRPERALQVSPFLGIGTNYALIGEGNNRATATFMKDHSLTFNLHGGLQMKLFAGPHAAITAEPFVMLSNVGLDLADNGQNWHKYEVSYGLNLSYIYYFDDLLTAPANAGVFKKRFRPGQRWLRGDSADVAQRHPLFIEYAAGATAFNTFEDLRWGSTVGPAFTLAVGSWLSPATGLRLGLNAMNADWSEQEGRVNMMGYMSASIDAMLNPFGFRRDYDWEAPVGMNLFAGYELGLLKMVNTGDRNRSLVMGYRLGMQGWARLSHDTRLFVEPMYAFLLHRQGQENRKRDDHLSVKLGIEMLLGGREDVTLTPGTALPQGYFIALGGGWNTTVRKWKPAGHNTGIIKNGLLTGGYHFDAYNGVTLSGEYLTDVVYGEQDETRWKNWLISADYELGLSNYITGYNPARRWNVSALLGPTVALNSEKTRLGLNAGLQLDYRLSRHLALFYLHRIYWMDKHLYESDQLYNQAGTVVSSMNVGLMYRFDDLVGPVTRVAVGTANGVGSAARTVGHAVGRGVRNLFDQNRSPFFMDYGYGVAWFPGMPASSGDTWGTSLQLSMGWWMLPALGIRGGVNATKGGAIRVPAQQAGASSDVITSVGSGAVFADLLFNPLGLKRNYDWDQRFGFHLIGGLHKGIIAVEGKDTEARGRDLYASGWRAGLNLWVKLQDDLRLHIEPMYTRMDCDEIFIDDDTHLQTLRGAREGYSLLDAKDAMSVRLGLTALLRNPKKRGQQEAATGRFFAAAGGGWNFNLNKWRYENSGLNYNGLLMAGYTFNGYHTVRAQWEFVSDDVAEYGEESYRQNLNFLSLNYQLSLTTLFGGDHANRRWEVGVFGGPSMDNTQHLGLNGGVTAGYRIDDHWGVFYNHNIYLFTLFDDHKLFPTEQISSRVSTVNTFNLGVSWRF